MAGEKLRQMKAAARHLLDYLGEKDLLSIVIFDDVNPAELVVPAAPVTDRIALSHKIDLIEERGGTHMSTGMELGLRELRRGQSPERASSMFLLTDGQTWEDQDVCRSLADQCQASGISLYVFGLGTGAESNWDPRLLEDLALRSGGEWTLVETPEQVAPAFKSALQAMQGAAATNAQLTIRLIQGLSRGRSGG